MHFVALADAWASWLESIVGFLALVLYSYNPHIELSLKKKTDTFSWRKGPFLRVHYLRGGAACRCFCAAALEIRLLADLGSDLR